MIDHRATVFKAVSSIILRDAAKAAIDDARLTPVLAALKAASGRVDVHELVSEWLRLIYGLASQHIGEQLARRAAEALAVELRERNLKASYALQIEALTNLVEHLLVDTRTPFVAQAVLDAVDFARKRLMADAQRSKERDWATQEVADRIDSAKMACYRQVNAEPTKRASPTRPVEEPDVGPRPECEKIPVYFATYRKRAEDTSHTYDMYGGQWSDTPSYGRAIVSVPNFRQQFSLPRDTAKETSIRETETINRGRYFVVDKIDLLTSAELAGKLNVAVKRKTLLVFIHGFRQSHASALVHAAQLFKDLDVLGSSLVLSWPSGYLLGDQSYFDAIAQAKERQLPQKFAALINDHVASSEATQVMLIGHSLGARMLASALEHIRFDVKRDQIVLGSPDIELDHFHDVVAPAVRQGVPLTVYASGRDKALRAATYLESERAGRFPYKIASHGIDVVATDLCYSEYFDFNRHSDFSYGAAPDLRQALKRLKPDERRLRAKRAPNRQTYWSFG